MSNSKNIAVRLSDFASQENCDGEPYDTMQAASEYIRELEARLAAAEADAERYRWLRDEAMKQEEVVPGVLMLDENCEPKSGKGWRSALHGDALDAAIDAARGGE